MEFRDRRISLQRPFKLLVSITINVIFDPLCYEKNHNRFAIMSFYYSGSYYTFVHKTYLDVFCISFCLQTWAIKQSITYTQMNSHMNTNSQLFPNVYKILLSNTN